MDATIISFFGKSLEEKVQQRILNNYFDNTSANFNRDNSEILNYSSSKVIRKVRNGNAEEY